MPEPRGGPARCSRQPPPPLAAPPAPASMPVMPPVRHTAQAMVPRQGVLHADTTSAAARCKEGMQRERRRAAHLGEHAAAEAAGGHPPLRGATVQHLPLLPRAQVLVEEDQPRLLLPARLQELGACKGGPQAHVRSLHRTWHALASVSTPGQRVVAHLAGCLSRNTIP
jgi:hypothetical protein